MSKKPKTLGRFLTKKYITTSLLMLLLISALATIAQFFVSGTNDIVKDLCAETIVRPDYKKINISALQDVNGWLEILDDNNHVIYTKGPVGEKKTHYTQKQLLEMEALQSVIKQKIYQIGPVSFKRNTSKKIYGHLCSFQRHRWSSIYLYYEDAAKCYSRKFHTCFQQNRFTDLNSDF